MTAGSARRLPRADRERQMLDAASDVFSRKGFEPSTMDEIARAVGVTKPMLYSYFGSKEGLFLACTERAADRLIVALEAASRGSGPLDQRLATGLRALFDWLEDEPEIGRLLLGRPRPASPGPLAVGVEGLRARVAAVSERLMREQSREAGAGPEALEYTPVHAHLLAAVIEAAAERWLAHRDEPKELQVLMVMNFAWQGLGAMSRGELWFAAGPAGPLRGVALAPTDAELEGLLTDDRAAVLERVFAELAARVHPEATRDVTCTFEWRVGAEDRFQVHVSRGTCAVERGGRRRPDVTYRIEPLDFLRLMTGVVPGPELWVRGRLRTEGDAVLSSRAGGFFQPPPLPPV